MAEECLFCKVYAGELPSKEVLRDGDVYAFEDIRPVAPVHVLIIPKQHIPSVHELRPEHGPIWLHMVQVANRVADQRDIAADGYRLVVNCGPQAGQSVYHVHLHLLGGRSMNWPPG
ncbi:MAG TPA: histidine triad nucleotide-binding protein [Candidatus Limnocylindrales bacterium]|nr:histidine triad nucleotide-binding protein [Candidatus Limnocylindrales bacterium]